MWRDGEGGRWTRVEGRAGREVDVVEGITELKPQVAEEMLIMCDVMTSSRSRKAYMPHHGLG